MQAVFSRPILPEAFSPGICAAELAATFEVSLAYAGGCGGGVMGRNRGALGGKRVGRGENREGREGSLGFLFRDPNLPSSPALSLDLCQPNGYPFGQ